MSSKQSPLKWSQEIYLKAYRFAADAHHGQLFPGTELPYLMHLGMVCMEVMAALNLEEGHDENLAVQCALLHDTIEDTDVTFENVAAEFGHAVAEGVQALSKDKNIPKSEQLSDSLQRIRSQPKEIWMVKLADRISNLQAPPHYWTKEKITAYRAEAQQIHDALHEASSMLAARLEAKVDSYRQFE